MSEKVVHVVGTGTIGEPLIGLLSDYKEPLGIDEVSFHKNSPLSYERAKVRDLMNRGAKLAVHEENLDGFKDIGLESSFFAEEAIERATVVIDCTPKGIGHENKHKYYERFIDNGRGFLAQGSEHGFGLKYARGINDSALTSSDNQFVQIVSCNTHNIAALTKSITMHSSREALSEGRFVCIRRSSDISQTSSFVPAPEVGLHGTEGFGTHHARDAYELFQTLDKEPNLFSSAMKTNSQYMHVIWFSLKLNETVTMEQVIERLDSNPLIALTEKTSSSSVFSFGRDHGHFGRILNQTVVAVPTLAIHDNNEVVGYCFTPQDGNSLLSSIAGATYFMYPDSYEERIQSLGHLFFSEV
jgi:glyceraldehyde-3-phosphate dehydrogenase (NAD(P))